MKKLLLAAALFCPGLTFAQTLPNPTFVPAWNNQNKLPLLTNLVNPCSTNQFVNGFDATGRPTCATPTTGSSTAAAGSNGQFQTNSAGSLAGVTISGDFTIDGTTGVGTIGNGVVTNAKMATGAAVGNIGYTPANRAGDTFTGNVTAPFFVGNGSLLTNLPSGNFTGTGSAPITQSVTTKLDRDLISVADYAVASNTLACATDATTGLQNAFNRAGNGSKIKVPSGIWCFTQLTLPVVETLECDSGGILVKIGATGDGIIGNNVLPANYYDVTIRGCILVTKSGVTPTSGSMFHFTNARHLTFDNTFVGTRQSSANGTILSSYNAYEIGGVDSVTFSNSGAWGAANDCMLAYGTATSFDAELRLTNNSQFGGCRQKAVHISGGLGGIYCESVDEVTSGVGFYVDTAAYAVTNREVFLSRDCTMDSNTTNVGSHGFYFAPNSIGVILGSPWPASNSGAGLLIDQPQSSTLQVMLNAPYFYGNGLHGVSAQAGNINISGGVFFNNGSSGAGTGSGILIFGSGVQSAQITGITASNNSSFGVDDQANAGVTRVGALVGSANTSGMFRSVNGMGGLSMPSTVNLDVDPTQGWGTNSSNGKGVFNVAPGGIVTLAPGSGKIIINDQTNGHVCEFLVGGGAVVLTGQTAGDCLAGTSSPGANQMSVYFNGSTNYVFKSNQATTRNFTISTWSTRNAA